MILDGTKVKNIILDEIKEKVSNLFIKPKLVVIQIGEDEASNIYIKQKINMCNYVGYEYKHIKLNDNIDTDSVLELIDKLNNDDSVNGILVQLPLPSFIDKDKVVNAISPLKDVDGLTDYNGGKLFHNKDCLYSCTPYGIMELLDRYDISVSGKNVVILSRSNHIGKPLAMMMLNKDATVTMCHSSTQNLNDITRNVDILIAAVGKPNFITSDMVSENAIVIDVGMNRLSTGLCGDVSFEQLEDKVKYITPVPGGVGPMTVASLAKNILKSYNMQNK